MVPVRIWHLVKILLAPGLLLLLCLIIILSASPSGAQDRQPNYDLLGEMRLPWVQGDAEPRMLTQDWWSGHIADGLAWDFGRSGAPTPSPVAGTDVLAPMAGYVTGVRQQDPGYGNYVDIQGDQDWAVRLAHLQHQSGVASEFSGTWIPRGVLIGQLGNTGSSDYPYHFHLELLWQGGRPPATGDDYPDDYLPADSYPFGVPRSSLERPAEDREIVSNQDRYRPTLEVSWPLRGCAVVKGRTSYLSFFTVEPSKLHQYRWRVTRVTDQTVVAQTDWSDSPDSGNSLQGLQRGQYEWWAQARFPDIRYGHEDEWFESDSRAERFRLLDLANPFDWPAYLYYRFLTRCVMAAPRGAPDNAPPLLPPPSVEPEQLSSPVGCDESVDLGDEQDEAAHGLEGWSGLRRNQPVSPSGDTTLRYQPIRGQASVQLCVPQTGVDYVLTAEVQDFGCTDNFQIYVDGQGPIYSFTGSQSNRIIVHTVPISAAYVRSTAVEVTFKNTATDSCGAAAVYNVALATPSQLDQAQRPAPPATGRIAFTSTRDGDYEIYVMNADGSGQTNVSRSPGLDMTPRWSSDGQWIAFTSNRDGNYEVYVMKADGSQQTRLTDNPAYDYNPLWSADGQWIRFESSREWYHFYIMRADGSDQKLFFESGLVWIPWLEDQSRSPDGQWTVFICDADDLDGLDQNICIRQDTDSHSVNLTEHSAYNGDPAWSPS